ncbi:unnamed protein product [Blepharisma stoltei]|uniref:Uncharacterized protein n=1 Tax=Blepharisma stoltei TaxID=1481888 RepID=A0AAU9JAC0_9CILI|nr:unnamed protein product [Blepharisma stoltei]
MSENKRLMMIETHLSNHLNFNTKNTCLDEYRKRERPFNSEQLREMIFNPFYTASKKIWNAIKDRPDLFNRLRSLKRAEMHWAKEPTSEWPTSARSQKLVKNSTEQTQT